MAVAATRVTAVVVAVVLTVARRVSLMVIALRVLTVTRLPVPKRHHALRLLRAHTQAAPSNRHAHLMVATTAATTMIALLAQVAMPATAATLVAVKTVVPRLLIVVVRIHALVLRAVTLHHARMKVVKSVVHSAVIAHTLALPLVMATAMIARRVLSATVIHVRLLIARHAPILSVRIANNVRSALQHRAANTHHVHAPSVRSHSSAQSVRSTPHVQRVRSSTKLARRVIQSAPQVPPQRHRPMVATARLAVQPSRLNTLRR